MPSSRMSAEERKALVEAMRSKQRAADRRKAWWIYGTGGVIVTSIVGATAFVVIGEVQKQETVKAEAARPIEGVQEFPDQSRNHISGAVSYPRNPPTGGDHAPVWTNCDVYTAPVEPTRAVHSLEHGAVWLSYRPDLPQEQVAELASLAGAQDYLLLSPVTDQTSPITATAWGQQLSVDTSSDERIATFIKKYRQSADAPEPGAVCSGGVDG